MNAVRNIGFIVLILSLSSCLAKQDNITKNTETLEQKLANLSSFAHKLEEENSRFAELNQKEKTSSLTSAEEKELKEIVDREITKFLVENSASAKSRDCQIIVFEESRCKKCHKVVTMTKEIATDLKIKVKVLKPEGFDAYIKENNLLDYPTAYVWQAIFLEPNHLNKSIENNSFPVMLFTPGKGIFTISNVKNIAAKSELQNEIKSSLNVWGYLQE